MFCYSTVWILRRRAFLGKGGNERGEAGEPALPATPFLVDTEGVVQTRVSAASGVTATWLPILASVRGVNVQDL